MAAMKVIPMKLSFRAARERVGKPMTERRPSVFGARLSELLRTKNISQATLARRLNVSPQEVWHWCQGHAVPDALKLVELAALLGTSVEFLFWRPRDRSPRQ